jgi:hypothetical protein
VETGAVSCHIYEDVEAPAVFCLISQWENRQAYETHLRGSRFGAILGALVLLALPPQFVVMQSEEPSGGDPYMTLRRLRESRGAGMGNPPVEGWR